MTLDRTLLKASWHDWCSFRLHARGPEWLQWLWTGLLCLALALGITAMDLFVGGSAVLRRLAPSFVNNLVISLTIGLLIQGQAFIAARVISRDRLHRLRPGGTSLLWAAMAVVGVGVGWPLGFTLAGHDFYAMAGKNPVALRAALLFAMLLTAVILVWATGRVAFVEAQRRATEAQLRLLQAQMEPHFLFNTLANVLSLIDTDPPRARHMLESFVDYLRSSLSGMRSEHVTLGAEIALASAYLELQQVRMGERLRYEIDVDADTHGALLPPLLLQPLVENAVLHGLEPQLDGGRLVVRAHRQADRLVLDVVDESGLRQAASRPGAGIALENLRTRLAARYGKAASLTLTTGERGTRASITLPYEGAPA